MDDPIDGGDPTPSQRLDRADEHLRRARDALADAHPDVADSIDDALADVSTALDRLCTERRLDGDLDALFDALGDADCRAILLATDEPRTARELIEQCQIPRSTVYRKLDRLTDAGLLEETVRVNASGNHPAAYVRRVDQLRIPADEVRAFQVTIASRETTDGRRSVTATTASLAAGTSRESGAAADPVPNPLGTGSTDGARWFSAWEWPDSQPSD
ncbi:MAG: helix-turn-helix domain-containing protein [Haloarculaceae archaeon]